MDYCLGWVSFIKSQYPDYVLNLSSAKSPQQMFGAVAKSDMLIPKDLGDKSHHLLHVHHQAQPAPQAPYKQPHPGMSVLDIPGCGFENLFSRRSAISTKVPTFL